MSELDDEFQRIISGMSADELPENAIAESLFEYLDLPAEDTPLVNIRTVGIILTPFSDMEQIAAILSVYGLDRWLISFDDGQVAMWLELDPEDPNNMDHLLGEERPIPEECDRFARILSKLSPIGVVAIVSNILDEDGETNGDVRARRYVGGKPEEIINAGTLVATMHYDLEDFLLGRLHPGSYSRSTKTGDED